MKKLTQAIQKLEKLFNGKLVQKGSGGNFTYSKSEANCVRHLILCPQYKITFFITYMRRTESVHITYKLLTNYPRRLGNPMLGGHCLASLKEEWTPEFFEIEDGKVISLFTDYTKAEEADLVKLAAYIKRESSVLEANLKHAKKLCVDLMKALAMLCTNLGLPKYIVEREDRIAEQKRFVK